MMAVTHSQLGQICCTIIHSHSRTGCGNGLQYNHQLSTTNLPQLCCCTESVTTRRVDFVSGLCRAQTFECWVSESAVGALPVFHFARQKPSKSAVPDLA